MSESLGLSRAIETDQSESQSVISATTVETIPEDEPDSEMDNLFINACRHRYEQISFFFSNLPISYPYPNINITLPVSFHNRKNVILTKMNEILLSETTENIFLGAILLCFIAVIFSLLSPYYYIH
jgi:hypothetical protein